MKVIITIVGERASGKTQLARELQVATQAIVLSPDLGALLRVEQFDLKIGSRLPFELPEETRTECEWHYLDSIQTLEA